MKTLFFAAALSVVALSSYAQENPPAGETGVESKELPGGGYLGIVMEVDGKEVKVTHVQEDSAAAKAGLAPGAVILGIDGKTIEGTGGVSGVIRTKKAGEEIELSWRQEDRLKVARIPLGTGPWERQAPAKKTDAREPEGVPEGDRPNFRFTPAPRQKYLPPAERQLKELGPEVDVDPFKEPVKERSPGFSRGPRVKIVPREPDFRTPGGAPNLNLEAPRVRDLDAARIIPDEPGKLEGKFESGGWEAQKDRVRWMKQAEKAGKGAADELKSATSAGGKTTGGSGRREDTVWERVEKQVSAALEKTSVDAAMKEKVMKAIEEARKEGPELTQRQKMEAEVKKLEREAQEFLERAGKIRRELQTSE